VDLYEIDNIEKFTITCYFQSTDDLMVVALLADALKEIKSIPIKLMLPYMPSARQDRIANKGESFGLRVYANFLNSLNIDTIHIVDPHSDVVAGMFPAGKLVIMTQADMFNTTIEDITKAFSDVVLLAPDAGAEKKTAKLANQHDLQYYTAGKCRDTNSGKLSRIRLPVDLEDGCTIFIVDDILDGGGTFVGLMGEIKKQCPRSKVILCVTHGIFSKGWLDEFDDFEQIFVGFSDKRFLELKATVLNKIA
jgi:ribose-phosphate pyrophosphokinase